MRPHYGLAVCTFDCLLLAELSLIIILLNNVIRIERHRREANKDVPTSLQETNQ